MKYLKFLFIISVLSLFSCQNADEVFISQDSINQNQNPVIDKLVATGYDRDEIKEYDDFFLVEGDLMFSKKIEDYPNNAGSLTKQAYNSGNLLDLTRTNISVYIDNGLPSSGQDNWRTAISSAINDWNNISGSSVYFHLSTNSNSDITIKSDNGVLDDNGIIASAGFPFTGSGKPYDTVLLNLNVNNDSNIIESVKRYTMVHELGHCIGLRHTDWYTNGESSAFTIPGTPSIDSNSVMNHIVGFWNGFSTFDAIAAQYLFPYSVKVEYVNDYSNSEYGPDTVEIVDDIYVRLYTNGSYTTALGLPATVKYSIITIYTEGQSQGQTSTSSYVKVISSGSGNRYFLKNITSAYCEYDYGDPVGDCYQRWARF